MIGSHGDGGVSHKVEHEDELIKEENESKTKKGGKLTYHHECRGKENPTDKPVVADSVTNHLLDAEVEPLGPEHPAVGDSLEEDTP